MMAQETTTTEVQATPAVEVSSALPEPAEQASVNWEGISDEILTDEEGTTVEGDLEVADGGAAPEGFAKPAEVAPAEVAPVTTPAPVEPCKRFRALL